MLSSTLIPPGSLCGLFATSWQTLALFKRW